MDIKKYIDNKIIEVISENNDDVKDTMFNNRKKTLSKYDLTKSELNLLMKIMSTIGFTQKEYNTTDDEYRSIIDKKLVPLNMMIPYKKGYILTKLGKKLQGYVLGGEYKLNIK